MNLENSPYQGKEITEWRKITDELIGQHPLTTNEIVEVVLKSWKDIFNSKIGSFFIGKDIFPTPQIMSFLLHELVAHYLGLKYPSIYKVGTEKNEKDVHHLFNPFFSIEIKASSNAKQIFANRSYAQIDTGSNKKNKNGYYITVNFENFKSKEAQPEITLIRFGYIEHTDWLAQKSATGQQARLSTETYQHKLKIIYPKP